MNNAIISLAFICYSALLFYMVKSLGEDNAAYINRINQLEARIKKLEEKK